MLRSKRVPNSFAGRKNRAKRHRAAVALGKMITLGLVITFVVLFVAMILGFKLD